MLKIICGKGYSQKIPVRICEFFRKSPVGLTSLTNASLAYARMHYNRLERLDLDELISTASTIVVAGFDKIGALLSELTYYLLINQPVFEKLKKEIRESFKSSQEITMASVKNLEYVDAVILEAMRLCPLSPTSLRRKTQDLDCQIAGNPIPGDTYVVVNQFSAFRSSQNFKRPLDFIPERWMKNHEFRIGFDDDKINVFKPFGVGMGSCPAKNMTEALL